MADFMGHDAGNDIPVIVRLQQVVADITDDAVAIDPRISGRRILAQRRKTGTTFAKIRLSTSGSEFRMPPSFRALLKIVLRSPLGRLPLPALP